MLPPINTYQHNQHCKASTDIRCECVGWRARVSLVSELNQIRLRIQSHSNESNASWTRKQCAGRLLKQMPMLLHGSCLRTSRSWKTLHACQLSHCCDEPLKQRAVFLTKTSLTYSQRISAHYNAIYRALPLPSIAFVFFDKCNLVMTTMQATPM